MKMKRKERLYSRTRVRILEGKALMDEPGSIAVEETEYANCYVKGLLGRSSSHCLLAEDDGLWGEEASSGMGQNWQTDPGMSGQEVGW